ncbi:hypothetical protein ACVBEG_26890 [Pseudomonas sp. GG8]
MSALRYQQLSLAKLPQDIRESFMIRHRFLPHLIRHRLTGYHIGYFIGHLGVESRSRIDSMAGPYSAFNCSMLSRAASIFPRSVTTQPIKPMMMTTTGTDAQTGILEASRYPLPIGAGLVEYISLSCRAHLRHIRSDDAAALHR